MPLSMNNFSTKFRRERLMMLFLYCFNVTYSRRSQLLSAFGSPSFSFPFAWFATTQDALTS